MQCHRSWSSTLKCLIVCNKLNISPHTFTVAIQSPVHFWSFLPDLPFTFQVCAFPLVTSVYIACHVQKYVLRMHNRKLRNIRPSGTFWPEVTSVTWPEAALTGSMFCACPFFLAHLAMSWVSRPSISFSHLNLPLWNRWTDFNQTCQKCSLDGPLTDLCFWCWFEIQHGCQGL
jgi:hypothetical protein